MIASLTGIPKSHTSNSIILDVRGVGYKVFTSTSLIQQVQKDPKPITLFTHTHVRDDALDLYGFKTLESLQLFELIINISGIGPKIAIVLIDKGVDHITTAVSKADVDFFTSIPRLGKKNAQKIIIELKPKLGDLEELDLIGDSPDQKEALNALTGLGFSKKESLKALSQSSKPGDSVEQKITQSIRYLGKK